MQFGKPGGVVQNADGGSGSGGAFTLLWENPNPGSSFAAQPISVDLTDYDLFAVIVRFSTGSDLDLPMEFFDKTSRQKTLTITSATSNRNGERYISYNAETKVITFGGASYNSSSNNNYVLPQKIFGVKF